MSGKGQIDGDGPERQRDYIEKFCKTNLLPSPVFFQENAVSGTVDGLDRPAFLQMLQSVEASGKPACIVVERMDRLARDLIVSELVLKECASRKIPVYAADQGTLVDQASMDGDPTRKLIRQILGALAEWEKTALVMKLRAARDRKRRETGRCEGVKPYGATCAEQEIKDKFFEWRSLGASYSTVAENANNAGFCTRQGQPWKKASVYQVINRGK